MLRTTDVKKHLGRAVPRRSSAAAADEKLPNAAADRAPEVVPDDVLKNVEKP